MTAELAIALAGWVAAGAAGGCALVGARLSASRREALARASHELRGPITAARLGIALALRGAELPSVVIRTLDLELSRAALALDDLSGVSGPRARATSRWVLEPVDLRALLVDCVEASRAGAGVRGVRLRLEWSGPAWSALGDRVRLAQATGNLIANAIEHGKGEVVVRGRADAGLVRVEVTDGGYGLPASVDELVRRARRGRGTRGRGLAIAASIAARHGGRVGAAPSDRGARLVLELPAIAAGAPPARRGGNEEARSGPVEGGAES